MTASRRTSGRAGGGEAAQPDGFIEGVVVDRPLSAEVEWDDEFEPLERQRFDWDLIAATLRSRPGRWARLPGVSVTLVTEINRRSGPVALREGRWEAASRRGALYLRHLGPDPKQLE